MRSFLASLIATLSAPLVAPSPAFAQTDWDANAGVQSCMQSANPRACVGAEAQRCMGAVEGGQTTLGMAMCTQAATVAWDRVLNAQYAQTMAWNRAMDAEDRVHFPEFANREKALRDAQRAWIAFRDAECAMAYAQWGAGSMRHIAGTSCHLDMTATRAIDVLEMRESMQ